MQNNSYTGITVDKARPNQPYRCRVRIGNKQYFVGRYKTKEEAFQAKEKYLIEYYKKIEQEKNRYLKYRTTDKIIKEKND